MQAVTALDIDDVVVRHVEGFIRWSNQHWETTLTLADYSEAWHEIWGIDLEETEARKKLFFTDEVVGAFEVIDGAGAGITALAQTEQVIGVTSRREGLQAITETVLNTLAPGAVSGVIFATSFRSGQKVTRSKADICTEIGATILIEDHLKHCLAVQAAGVKAVLFGDYPWNQTTDPLPTGIVRAANWKEVPVALQQFRS